MDLVHPVQRTGMAVLAEQVDLVAHPLQGLGEAGVVDVAARPPQQVAVEDQHAHGAER
jgi:hypothetical protein